MTTTSIRPIAVKSGAARMLSLVLATLSQAGMTVAHQGVVVVGIFFAAAYHLTLSQMGLVVSFVSLGWMCSGLFTGLLVDRLGPRIVLFCGTLLMSAAATFMGLTNNLIIICALLFVIGLGVSTVSLAGTVTVMTSWSRAERGLPMGIRQMGVPAGSMIAAFTLPTITARYGLHTLFWIFAAELFALGMAFCLVLPPSLRTTPHLQLKEPTPKLWRDLRHITLPCFAGFLLAWSQYTLLTFTIPMLHDIGKLSVTLAGVALAMAQISGGIARIGLGALSDRLHGRHDLVLVATAAAAAVLALLVGVLPMRLPLPIILTLWFVLGAAMVGWNALIVTWSGERVRERNAGAAMGLTSSCVLFGAIITAPIMGGIIQVTGTFASAWITL
ncbi:MAG TPA: MFS transporter, partial [Ktedonobacterales bacterium]|nr:MFS transporter [Ktedonobacterales bacterium]